DPARGHRVSLRPEALEWPVRLAFPPLLPRAVRVRTGFALCRARSAQPTLESVRKSTGLVHLRDPERRALTLLEWDAAPRWPSGVKPMHTATVAGFDVHELDVDELAVSDTTAGADLAVQRRAWERARRVARVQLLRESA